MADLMSLEEVLLLTVPKLKAELTRLNQPIDGLKRKAQLVEALTTYIEKQQQQAEETPTATAAASPTAAAAAATAAVENEPEHVSDAPVAPGAEEEPAAQEQVDRMDTTAADVPAQQAELAATVAAAAAPAPAPPAQTPSRKSRKRTTRMDDEEASTGKPRAAAAAASSDEQTTTTGGEEQQSSPSQVSAPAAKRKKIIFSEENTEAAEEDPAVAPVRQQRGTGGDADAEKGNGTGHDNGTATATATATATTTAKLVGEEEVAAEAVAADDDPMGEEGVAPSSEPGGVDPAAPGTDADADADTDAIVAGATAAEAAEPSAGSPSGKAGSGGDDGVGGGDAEEQGAGSDGTEEHAGEEEEGSGRVAVDPVTIRVDNFVRPFTASQAKKLLEDKAGASVLEGGFWMDSIKTHCYATFDGREAAEKAIAALQGLQWPVQSFKKLEAKIGDMSAEEARARDDDKRSNRPFSAKKRVAPVLGPRVTSDARITAGGGGGGGKANGSGTGDSSAVTGNGAIRVRGRGSVQAPGVPGSQGGILAANVEAEVGRGRRQEAVARGGLQQKQQQRVVEEELEPIVLDEMFRKTAAKPSLYWMPLLEEEVGERKKQMEKDGVGPRTTPMPADHVEAAGGGRSARGNRGSGGGGGGGGWGGGGGGRRGSGGGGAPFRQGGYGRRR